MFILQQRFKDSMRLNSVQIPDTGYPTLIP